MTRILVASLLLTSALAARASPLLPRQESSPAPSLDTAYGVVQTFSSEVIDKMVEGECNEDNQCQGWMSSILECTDGGRGEDEATIAKCGCESEIRKHFDTCVACLATDSAKKASEALTSVCSSAGTGANNGTSTGTASGTSSGTAIPTSSGSASSSATSSGSSTMSPGSSSTTNTASGGNAAAPTESAGSGVDKLGMNSWTVLGMVGTGLVAGMYV